jgi:ectoine hydroxylase
MSLQRLFSRYTGWLRSLKAVYVINNLLNARQLAHNRRLYRQHGLQKSIFAPIGKRDFLKNKTSEHPWLDRPDALKALAQHPDFQTFGPEVQAQMRQFVRDGYMVLRGLIPSGDVSVLNAEVDQCLADGKAGFNYTGRKIFNFFEQSDLANERFFRHPELIRTLEFLLGREVHPFQTLNFTVGSEQRAHSDLIHMTTEPEGYMVAAWIALEPCTPDNGPVVYYPGSHRLPFVGTSDYDSGNTAWAIGHDSNRRYEDKIAQIIAERGLRAEPFVAEAGDVLIWHANLIHGGSAIRQAGATRRSMVCHYFAQGVICYHEMSQRPALITPTK